MQFTKKDQLDIVETAISWIVVFAMFVYGGAKIIQFDGGINIEKSVSELSGMELMWAFYGYSKTYAIILGILEITGGILVFFKRTRIIGCFFVSTILVNVIFQDIFFGVHVGALKAAVLYQVLLLLILWINREKLYRSARILLDSSTIKQSLKKVSIKLIIAFIFFVVLRLVEYLVTIKL